ncbi:HAMP domain-containing histidine kinase [Tyzzerella sp. OttesenSCG-928-J15]|nr:HAMP domain-containing histidine kinase [Tyzzerella sp. OttesenSCG-928-J15]
MDNYSENDSLAIYENVIHDIKGPMTIIYTYVQLLEVTKNMPKDALQHVEAIKRNCFKSLKLVNDINDSSKLRDGYLIPSFNNINIVDLLRNVTESTQPFTINKNLNLNFESSCEAKMMATDKALIERVLLNLLSNAVKSTAHNGSIWVKLVDLPDKVEITVEDNGRGIKAENLERIFERYHTGDSIRGRGIGLSIVKEIVEVLGGEINVKSVEGKGTKMIVTLPVFLIDTEKEQERVCDDFYLDNMVQIELADEYY